MMLDRQSLSAWASWPRLSAILFLETYWEALANMSEIKGLILCVSVSVGVFLCVCAALYDHVADSGD